MFAEFNVICLCPISFEIQERTREINGFYCDEHVHERTINMYLTILAGAMGNA